MDKLSPKVKADILETLFIEGTKEMLATKPTEYILAFTVGVNHCVEIITELMKIYGLIKE